MEAMRTGTITREHAGAILGTLCLAVHKTPPPSEALSLRHAMDARLQFAGKVHAERIIIGVFALIEPRPDQDGTRDALFNAFEPRAALHEPNRPEARDRARRVPSPRGNPIGAPSGRSRGGFKTL